MDKDLIPEAADGLVTVKRWASDVLYKLNPSRDDLQGIFLTNLHKAFKLARLRQEGCAIDKGQSLFCEGHSSRIEVGRERKVCLH